MAYVMVVDDDEDMNAAISIVLRDLGHEVHSELDTKRAQKAMEKRRPDLVVLDVMFPGNSTAGFTLARTMQIHSEKLNGIPILMLTAINSEFPFRFTARDIDKSWLPVADFVEKPVDPAILREKVSALLRKAAAPAAGASGSPPAGGSVQAHGERR